MLLCGHVQMRYGVVSLGDKSGGLFTGILLKDFSYIYVIEKMIYLTMKYLVTPLQYDQVQGCRILQICAVD